MIPGFAAANLHPTQKPERDRPAGFPGYAKQIEIGDSLIPDSRKLLTSMLLVWTCLQLVLLAEPFVTPSEMRPTMDLWFHLGAFLLSLVTLISQRWLPQSFQLGVLLLTLQVMGINFALSGDSGLGYSGFAATACLIATVTCGRKCMLIMLGTSICISAWLTQCMGVHGLLAAAHTLMDTCLVGVPVLAVEAYNTHSKSLVDRLRAERRNFELSHQRLQLTADAARIGLYEHDLENGIFHVNEHFRRIHHLPEHLYPVITDEIMLKRMSPELRSRLGKAITDAMNGRVTPSEPVEGELLLDDKTRRWVKAFVVPAELSQQIGMRFGCVLDVTDERKREAQLQASLDEIQSALYTVETQQKALDQANRQLEAALRRNEMTVKAGHIGLYEFHITSGLFQGNDMFRTLLELPEKEYPQITAAALIERLTPESRLQFQTIHDTHRENTESRTLNWELLLPDGKSRWLRTTSESRHDENGDLIIIGCVVDITEQHLMKVELEQSLEQSREALHQLERKGAELAATHHDLNATYQRLQQITSVSHIGTFEHDLATDIVQVNDIYREILQMPEDEFPVIHLNDIISLITPRSREQVMQKMKESLHGREPVLEVEMLRRDGSPVWLRAAQSPLIQDGKTVAIIGCVIDVTAHRELQQGLEESLRQTASSVRELETQRERQSQMFAVIGHELRTPVAAIQMMLEAQSVRGKAPYGDQLLETTGHLLEVLENLRAVARPEKAGSIESVIVQPFHVVEATLKAVEPLLLKRNMRFQLSGDPCSLKPCLMKERLLRQLLSNLAKNAAVHSEGHELLVSLTSAPIHDDQMALELRVADDGKGIPMEFRERLFEPFYRGNAVTDGAGLGLHICRDIARDLGGDLRYEERQEGGSVFIANFVLPLADSAKVAPPVQDTLPAPELKGVRVLVAEDNLLLQKLTLKLLTKAGLHVVLADDGKIALDHFEQEPFDLVLTDIFMPEMNGYELTRTLRERGYKGPIIGVTAATVGEETDQLLEAGATAAVSKPITLSKLEPYLMMALPKEPK
jgi:PAS domain S-box-containing protein